MMNNFASRQYMGDGERHYAPLKGALQEPEPYIASPSLIEAVNVALHLRRPLLLEGDPGCGKTRLAYAIAYELGYQLYECYIRSTSQARDLLYTYDAIRRLYDIQEHKAFGEQKDPPPLKNYIRPGKLGEAIGLSSSQDLPSVVLIDEIDKADLDFPNDLLLVLDQLQFEIDELQGLKIDALKGQKREARRDFLPLFLITSNREKELPKPFLRRCLFFYIDFPDEFTLKEIIKSHFKKELSPLFIEAAKKFWQLRSQERFRWRKIPGTSEFLDWVQTLQRDELAHEITAQVLASTPLWELPHLETLIKTQHDRDMLGQWQNG